MAACRIADARGVAPRAATIYSCRRDSLAVRGAPPTPRVDTRVISAVHADTQQCSSYTELVRRSPRYAWRARRQVADSSPSVGWSRRGHGTFLGHTVVGPMQLCTIALCSVLAVIQTGASGSPLGVLAEVDEFPAEADELAPAAAMEEPVASLSPKSGDARWLQYLETVSGWIMQRNLPTDNLTHCAFCFCCLCATKPCLTASTLTLTSEASSLLRSIVLQLQTGRRESCKRPSSSTETLLESCWRPVALRTTAHTLTRHCAGATSCVSNKPWRRHLRGMMLATGPRVAVAAAWT